LCYADSGDVGGEHQLRSGFDVGAVLNGPWQVLETALSRELFG